MSLAGMLGAAACTKVDKDIYKDQCKISKVYDDQGWEYRSITEGLADPFQIIIHPDQNCIRRYAPFGSMKSCVYDNDTRIRIDFYDREGMLNGQTIDDLANSDNAKEFYRGFIKDRSLLRNAGKLE